jgi:hypothetical protein
MATLIQPLLTGKPFESTSYRFFNMFQPIQQTKNKKSDFLAFVATPIIDYTILDMAFALDASIRLLNAFASACKAAYLFTLNKMDSKKWGAQSCEQEINDVIVNLVHILSSAVAQIFNILFSTLSLITRPIASLVEVLNDSSVGALRV